MNFISNLNHDVKTIVKRAPRWLLLQKQNVHTTVGSSWTIAMPWLLAFGRLQACGIAMLQKSIYKAQQGNGWACHCNETDQQLKPQYLEPILTHWVQDKMVAIS